MEKIKKHIRVVNLSGGYSLPVISESSLAKKNWVNYGIDYENDFFDTLIKRYETSQTNNSVMDGIVNLLNGKGIKFKDNQDAQSRLYDLTTEEDLSRILFDYKMFGNAAIQVVYKGKDISGFYHLPVNTLRAAKCDEYGTIRGYYYSSDWENVRLKPTYIPSFGQPEVAEDAQVLYFKRISPGKFYYGIPDYYSAVQYCAVEEEIANLHINNILNNFLPSTIINFNSGVPAEEEQFMVEQAIKDKYSGTSNAGKFILSFNENGDQKTTVETIRSENLHEQYKFLSEEAMQKIMLAHKLTSPLLVGVKDAAGFSSNSDELKTAYDIFNTLVITPMQREYLKPIKEILFKTGFTEQELDNMYIEPLIPYSLKTDMIDDAGSLYVADQMIEDQAMNDSNINVDNLNTNE
jgi:hypothetical protein